MAGLQDCRHGWANATTDPGTCVLDLNGTIIYSTPYIHAKYLSIALTVTTVYMVLALGTYEYRMRRTKRPPVNFMLCGAVTLQFIYCVKLLLELNHVTSSPGACTVFRYIGAVCYPGSQILIYTILWLRQRKFYSDPLLASSVNRSLKYVSLFLIISIYATGLVVPAFIIKNLCSINLHIGCVLVWNRQNIRNLAPAFITSLLVCFLCQLILFALITYPLVGVDRLHKSDQHHSRVCTLRPDIRAMLIRIGICTAICVTSSLILHLLTFLDAIGHVCIFWPAFMCFDLVLSNSAVVCTFANWRHRVFPFVKAKIYYEGEQYRTSVTNL